MNMHKLVIEDDDDRRTGIAVRVPANDNGIAEGIARFNQRARNPVCICDRITTLDDAGLLNELPALRCPLHGWR